MFCKFLTQAGIDVGTASHARKHPAPSLAWATQQMCIHFLRLDRPLAIMLLGFGLVYWCVSGGGWWGMAAYAASPCFPPAGQGKALVGSLSHYPSLKNNSVPWDLMDRFSKHRPVTSAMASNLLGDVSTIWDGISICWWRSAAFLIFFRPCTFGLCAVEILGWYFQVSRFYCGETKVSPSSAGGKKLSALLTMLVLKLTVVTRGKKNPNV